MKFLKLLSFTLVILYLQTSFTESLPAPSSSSSKSSKSSTLKKSVGKTLLKVAKDKELRKALKNKDFKTVGKGLAKIGKEVYKKQKAKDKAKKLKKQELELERLKYQNNLNILNGNNHHGGQIGNTADRTIIVSSSSSKHSENSRSQNWSSESEASNFGTKSK